MPPQWPWSRRKSSASSPPEPFPAGIKLMHEGENDVADIIFIHGLTGDRERTWTAKNASLPWIKTLLPTEIPNVRILTFGYDAYVASWRGMVSKNRVGNHSMNLITAVAAYRENDNTSTRPIIFVCHSLGGLVCKDALIASRQRPERHLQNIFRCTRDIAFLGTPHSGADLAEWASKLAKSIGLLKQTNPQIIAVLETDSEVLARIQDNFHTMIRSRELHGLPPIGITCFYEELPLTGIGVVVPNHSAVIPGYTQIAIHKHHREMTKFERNDDAGFVAIVGELRRWTKELANLTCTSLSTASVQAKGRDTDVQIWQEPVPSFQSGKTSTGQMLQQTFYSNVNRRSVGHFVARLAVQEELSRWLLSDSSSSPVVLYGIGGSGKTQLAIQCCREAEESGFLATLWVDASSPISVAQSYNAIAKAIQKDFPDEADLETTISLVQYTLRSWPQRWLMVFDNYDNPKAFREKPVREYIPESGIGYILFTSRHTGLEHLGGNQVSVSSMTQSESLDLLLQRLPSSLEEEKEASNISNSLGRLALALHQAGAYIRSRKLALTEFMSHYEKRKEIIFREVSDDWEYRNQDGPLSVFTTWELSFSLLSGDEKLRAWKNDFLTLAGFFDPKRISERYFRAYCDAQNVEWMNLFRVDGNWDSYALGDILAELHKLSLIQLPDQELGERSFTIHPIVCDWLVYRRGKTKQQEKTMELANALAAFLKCSEEEDLPLEVNQETTLHLDCCLRHERAAYRGTGNIIPKIASLFARFYRTQGRYTDADTLLRLALAENERRLGLNHPDTLSTVENLAIISRRQGNYYIAEQLLKRALAVREQRAAPVPVIATPVITLPGGQDTVPGPVDELRTVQNLANVYSDQGRYDEAEDLFEQALKGMDKNLGPQHLEILGARQNLANVYRKRGKYKDAELLYQSVLEEKQRRLGMEHSDTLGTAENLANIYRKQQRYDEAEKIFERSVEIKDKKLGPEHPETLRAVQNLANLYSDQEQYDKAEHLYQRALQGNEKLLGLEHPDTIRTVENLGILYSKASSQDPKIGSYSLAQQLLERALKGNKKRRGPDHPDTLGTMESLAIVHYRHEEYDKAENLLDQILPKKEKILGKQHAETLGTVKNLGNVHYKLGRYDEAELEYKQALAGKEKLEQPDTLGTMQNLANIYRKQGRPNKAEEVMVLSSSETVNLQSEEGKQVASPADILSAQKESRLPSDSMAVLPKGILSVSIFRGRGLRPSGNPYLVCQFQGVTHISKGPKLDGESEEINGGPRRGKRREAGGGKDSTSLALPIAMSSNREGSSSGRRSYRAVPLEIKSIINPIWDWDVSFDIFSGVSELVVQVYDRSDGGNAFLGLLRFNPGSIRAGENYKYWCSLEPRVDEKDPKITGEIYIGISFQTTRKETYGPEDFQILDLIGEGTDGQAFKIRKKDTKSIYAMKVWQKKITDVPQRRIPHLLFIAGTKFSFEAGINLYIVTDYLPGGELFCHFEKEGRWFSEERVRFYVAEIVLALEELHNHNIIYRDLKPENILLDATGHIGLCGFGLSRTSKVLRTNTFCGTTEYLAPEVLLDENGFTNMVDFWSLGVLFFHMSFGWSPFYADTQQMYKNICFGKARFPRNVLSTEGVNLVKGLLNRNPKHRLGVSGGAEELKRHPFFASIEWDALAKKLVTPPLTPPLESQAGPLVSVLSNSLDNRIATLAANMRSTPFTLGMQANFKGFTFVDERSLDGHVQRLGVPDEEEEQGNDLEDLAIKIHRR